jgi:hypothetical protein
MSGKIVPEVQINDGILFRRVPTGLTNAPNDDWTNMQKWQQAKLPVISSLETTSRGKVKETVEEWLRNLAVKHLDNKSVQFWPPQLFQLLFSQETVGHIVDELDGEGQLLVDDTPIGRAVSQTTKEELRAHWVNRICNAKGQRFIQILAILVLMGKCKRIKQFVDKNFTDKDLPFTNLRETLSWKQRDCDSFNFYQWGFIVNFLEWNQNDACHYEFLEQDIKPWARTPRTSNRQQQNGGQSALPPGLQMSNLTRIGGYAEVYQMILHPWQHNFHEKLEEVSWRSTSE